MNDFVRDVRHSARVLLQNRGTTAIMVFTLALGIGATTAIFSVVYGVLLRPLPFVQSDRIMAVWEVNTEGRPSRLTDPNFDDFRDGNHTFQAMAKYAASLSSVAGGSQPTRTTVASVTPDFLKVFRVQPVIGRDFVDGDDAKGAAPTVLVSEGYWRQMLGAARDLSHAFLKIDNATYAVIGVLPAGFQFPTDAELWVPADLDGKNPSRTSHNYWAVGRLRDGATAAQAHDDISAIGRRIHRTSSEQGKYLLKDAMVLPLRDSLTRKARSPLLILLGAVGFLLLVACANVANLMLAQASTRTRELAVRSALGAGRGALVRQFLTEALLLTLAGGVAGVVGAWWGVASLLALAPASLPRTADVAVNLPVLVFAFGLSAILAAALGVFTAVRATTGDLRRGLVEDARGQAGGRSSQRVGRALVAAQMSITMVLVAGAGLLARSLMNVLQVDPGFRVDKIVSMELSLPYQPFARDVRAKSAQVRFYSELTTRLSQIPGVRKVGAASGLPLDGGLPDGMFARMAPNETAPTDMPGLRTLWKQKERIGEADFCVATRGYFEALGIGLVRGRLFDERDVAEAPHVALISESLQRAMWPKTDPIGHAIEFGNMDGDLRLLNIVGIVKDVREYGLDTPPRPTVYVNLFQRPRPFMTIALLSDADTRSVVGAARRILGDLDPDVAPQFRTFPEIYSASLGSRQFNAILLGFFGVTALLLATAGVFGVMAYTVSRRTREIGLRVALGASSASVLGLILGQGMRTILVGIAVGIGGAIAITRTLESMLFDVKANDPLTLGLVTLLLVGSALVASYIPARRAAKVDPMVALRYE